MRRPRDEGSAVAEFVMVAALLLFVATGVFQVGLALYVRNSLIAAASEGARYGARADSSPQAGAERTSQLISTGLSARFSRNITAAEHISNGVRVVQVVVRAPLPVIGPIGPSEALEVRGRAFSEHQVGVVP
ncbi:MAG: pilus assembly protein [Intrasporangium sp.]|uniref:TadE family protein n=1 Tax=Intrasporangium sp. TaxID=1925024 RepID=UPI00264706DE|nr:TadE family protein [Intrasporangium sp.]MDN5795228.1 pilus assembly protein [Intrasporangium sp.]